MDIVFQPSGNFDEVYLYEELMEADLHAIVSFILLKTSSKFLSSADPIRTATHGCPFPIFPLSNSLRTEIYPFRECSPPRPQAGQSPRKCRLRTQNLRFRFGARIYPRRRNLKISWKSRVHDWICCDQVVQGSGNYAELCKLRECLQIVIKPG